MGRNGVRRRAEDRSRTSGSQYQRRSAIYSWAVSDEIGARRPEGGDSRSRTVIAATLCGTLPDLMASPPTSRPGEWRRGSPWRTGSAFVFPFYSLPAWWFAGCGLDVLLGRRRVRQGGGVERREPRAVRVGYLMAPACGHADRRRRLWMCCLKSCRSGGRAKGRRGRQHLLGGQQYVSSGSRLA